MRYAAGGVVGTTGVTLAVEVPAFLSAGLDLVVRDPGGAPVAGLAWQVTLAGGEVESGATGEDGRIRIARATGACRLVLPALDGQGAAAVEPVASAQAVEPAASAQAVEPAAATAAPQAGPPESSGPAAQRQAILAKAREFLGRIDPRAGADGKRIGWELLKDLHDTSFNIDIFADPAARENIPKPHGKYVSWCGIFALAVAKKAGAVGPGVKWNAGGKISGGLEKIQGQTDKLQPGDIIIMPMNNLWHHAIVTEVDGERIATIDGNSFDAKTFQDQSVVEHADRKRSMISHWYKTVADQ